MRARLLAPFIALFVVIGVVGATPASAEVCRHYHTHYDFYEGWVSLNIFDIDIRHDVCVTRRGYTHRYASVYSTQSLKSKAAGYVLELGAIRQNWASTTFDGWVVYADYKVCTWKLGIRWCGFQPNEGKFKVLHRVARYDNSTTVVVVDNRVVRLAPLYLSDQLRWHKTSTSY